jgi:predicted amidohydrolase
LSILRLGVLAYPVTAPTDFAMFADKFDRLVRQGREGGADMLVMPEYASMELAAAGEDAGDVEAELADICAQRESLLGLFRDTARRHAVWLLPGSLPWDEGGRVRNRAPLISPDGRMRFQDKSVMTRFEAEQWGVQPGQPPCVFETPWGLIGIAICYDVEFPTLVRAHGAGGCEADPGAELHGHVARFQSRAPGCKGARFGEPVFCGRGTHGG